MLKNSDFLDHIFGIACRAVELLFLVGVAVFAEKGEGRFLSCLYAWLVVGIYVELPLNVF